MAYERRSFAGGAVPTSITASINGSDLSISIADATGWPDGSGGDFYVVIDRGTASEEKVLVDTRTATTLTVAGGGRGSDGTTGVAHTNGASIEHCAVAKDLDEANAHLSNQQADPHPMYLKEADLPGELASALADYLPLAGGTLSGDLDLGTNDITNGTLSGGTVDGSTVQNAKDKRYTANVSGSVTIDAANGPNQSLTMTGNVTSVSFSNLDDGESLRITWIQDGTGSRTFAITGVLWPGGGTAHLATFKTTANAVNVTVFDKIGSAIHGFLAGDMKT